MSHPAMTEPVLKVGQETRLCLHVLLAIVTRTTEMLQTHGTQGKED